MSWFDGLNHALTTVQRGGATWATFDDNPKAKKLVDDAARLQAALAGRSPGGWGPAPAVPANPPGAIMQGPQALANAAIALTPKQLLVLAGLVWVARRLLR